MTLGENSNFPQFVNKLRKWTERNPLPVGSNFLGERPLRDSPVNNSQLEPRQRGCVYCDSTEHRPHECTKVAHTGDRKIFLLSKGLCFNCAGEDHKATECKSRKTCLFCKRRHHTSICDKAKSDNSMTAAQIRDSPVVYPVVVVEVAGIKCRALIDSGAASSYASAPLLEKIGAKLRHSGMRTIENDAGGVQSGDGSLSDQTPLG